MQRPPVQRAPNLQGCTHRRTHRFCRPWRSTPNGPRLTRSCFVPTISTTIRQATGNWARHRHWTVDKSGKTLPESMVGTCITERPFLGFLNILIAASRRLPMFVKDGAITQTRWERVPDLEKVTCNGSPQGPASCTVRCFRCSRWRSRTRCTSSRSG